MKKTIILAVLLLLISTNASLACSRDPKVLEWLEKNGDIEQGKIILTKYPGAYETKASLTWTIEQGEKSYTSYFKGGIVAYDQELDEHYILFAPANLYNWSRQGEKVGKYLVIGTLGEGLVVINLGTLEIKRFRFEAPDNDVRILEVEGNKVIVNNTRLIFLPVEAGSTEARAVLRMVEPDYPESAEIYGIMSGKVRVKIYVLPSGEVSEIEIVLTSGLSDFDQCATEALMKWRFDPIEGEEVQSGIVTFRFESE